MLNIDSNHSQIEPGGFRYDAKEFAGYLANKLSESLRIIPGNELVQYIGCGDEQDNVEALESWVYMVCSSLKLPFSCDQAEMLESMLQPILTSISQELDCSLQSSRKDGERQSW